MQHASQNQVVIHHHSAMNEILRKSKVMKLWANEALIEPVCNSSFQLQKTMIGRGNAMEPRAISKEAATYASRMNEASS